MATIDGPGDDQLLKAWAAETDSARAPHADGHETGSDGWPRTTFDGSAPTDTAAHRAVTKPTCV